jgi:hypothetical protein
MVKILVTWSSLSGQQIRCVYEFEIIHTVPTVVRDWNFPKASVSSLHLPQLFLQD